MLGNLIYRDRSGRRLRCRIGRRITLRARLLNRKRICRTTWWSRIRVRRYVNVRRTILRICRGICLWLFFWVTWRSRPVGVRVCLNVAWRTLDGVLVVRLGALCYRLVRMRRLCIFGRRSLMRRSMRRTGRTRRRDVVFIAWSIVWCRLLTTVGLRVCRSYG